MLRAFTAQQILNSFFSCSVCFRFRSRKLAWERESEGALVTLGAGLLGKQKSVIEVRFALTRHRLSVPCCLSHLFTWDAPYVFACTCVCVFLLCTLLYSVVRQWPRATAARWGMTIRSQSRAARSAPPLWSVCLCLLPSLGLQCRNSTGLDRLTSQTVKQLWITQNVHRTSFDLFISRFYPAARKVSSKFKACRKSQKQRRLRKKKCTSGSEQKNPSQLFLSLSKNSRASQRAFLSPVCDYNGGMVEEERKLFSSGVVTHPSFFCLSLATDGNDMILLLMKNAQRIQTILYSTTFWTS